MTIIELFSKAFDSNLPEDWEAYYVADREKHNLQSLPRILIDDKMDRSELFEDEWEDMDDTGSPLNAYAQHWWGA